MLTPGALTSTERFPKLEKNAWRSLLSLAATASTFGTSYDAGYVGAESLSVPSFPAAATKSESRASANWIASRRLCEKSPPAHELLSTSAPFAAA